jgi:DnaJ-class molecular chaperone
MEEELIIEEKENIKWKRIESICSSCKGTGQNGGDHPPYECPQCAGMGFIYSGRVEA